MRLGDGLEQREPAGERPLEPDQHQVERHREAADVLRRHRVAARGEPHGFEERDGRGEGNRSLVALPEPTRPGEADRPIGPARVVHAQSAQHRASRRRSPAPRCARAAAASGANRSAIPRLVFVGATPRWRPPRVHGPTHPPRRGNGDRGSERLRAEREVVEARVAEAASRGDVADLLRAGLERAGERRGRRDAGRRGRAGQGRGGAHGAVPTGTPRSTVAIAWSTIAPATSTSVVCWSPRHPGIPFTSITSTRPSSARGRSTPA